MKTIRSNTYLLFVITLFTAFACEKSDTNELPHIYPDVELTDIDGNVYQSIRIGSQVWLAENFRSTRYNDNTEIDHITGNEDWNLHAEGAYCDYDNIESNSESMGRLYNWYAVATGKLAPEGWHVATNADWTELENYLIANGFNYDGTKELDRIAKSLASKAGWAASAGAGSPGLNPEKNNSTGFNAIPGGYRYDGGFCAKDVFSSWWSYSGEGMATTLNNEDCFVHSNSPNYKNAGNYVRLVKD